jgi:hypothetical protein
MTDVVTPESAPAAEVPTAAPQNITVNVAAPQLVSLPPKSTAVAYVLLIVVGVLGIHRFYIGKVGTGILYLLTGGILGIGIIVDLFTLAGQVRVVNARRIVGIK